MRYGPADRAAVLYVTDANGYFGSAVEIIRGLQLAVHLPPLFVVGIGYRLGGLEDTIAVRTRDFTPTHDMRFAALFPEQSRMGGAGALLAFIRDDLIPWVNTHYRTDPQRQLPSIILFSPVSLDAQGASIVSALWSHPAASA